MKKSIFLISTIMSGMIGYSATSMADDIDIYLKGKTTKQTFSNTMLVVDSSGSMNEYLDNGEQKLFAARKSIMELINNLNPNKRVGLATYNGEGGSIIYPIKSLSDRVYRESVATIKNNIDDFVEGKSTGIRREGENYLGFGNHYVEPELKTKTYRIQNSKNKTAVQCKDGTQFDMNNDNLYLGGFPNNCSEGFEFSLLFHDVITDIPKRSDIVNAYIELTRNDSYMSEREVRIKLDLYKHVGQKNPDNSLPNVFSDGQIVERNTQNTEQTPNPDYVAPTWYEGVMVDAGNPPEFFTTTTIVENDYKKIVDMSVEERRDPSTNALEGTYPNNMYGKNYTHDIQTKYVYYPPALFEQSRKVQIPNLTNMVKEFYDNNRRDFLVKISTEIVPEYESHDYLSFYSDQTSDETYAPVLVVEYYDAEINAEDDETFVGLNFREVNIASNSEVERGILNITASGNKPEGGSITVKVMDYLDTTNSPYDRTSINGMGVIDQKTVNFSTWQDGSNYTIDVKDLVESAVARSGFCGGDNILFVLESTTLPKLRSSNWNSNNVNISLRVKQGAVSENSCAKVSYYKGTTMETSYLATEKRYGNEALRTVKEQLIYSAMHDIHPKGKTPTLSSTLEAYKYMVGDYVSNKARYRALGENGDERKHSRVSHPDSYQDGTVVSKMYCTDNDYNNNSCASEKILGSPKYISPMTSLECETNNIVMLTDGIPFQNSSDFSEVNSIVGSDICTGNAGAANNAESLWNCIIGFSEYMANNDLRSDLAGIQTITTDVIGFDILEEDTDNTAIQDLMVAYAEAGKGQFLSVDNAIDLTSMMYEVVNTALDVTTIALPGVAVDQANKLQLRDELYFSLFVPSDKVAWGGNIKKYKVKDSKIVDINDVPAIDPDTGMFVAETQSAWSEVQDGSNSTLGGAANRGTVDRNIFTYLGTNEFQTLSGDEYRFSVSNSKLMEKSDHAYNSNGNSKNARQSVFMRNIRDDLMNNDTSVKAYLEALSANDPDRFHSDLTNLEEFLDWINGKDVFDEDADAITEEARLTMSDPLHVKPIIVNYDENNSTLFISTNDGTLHGVDVETGKELFAFVPEELIKNLYKKAYLNEIGKHQYGLDLTWVAYRHDEDGDGVIGSDANDFVNIYGGMRRGGHSIYSLDVTKITGAQLSDNRIPKFNWKISPEQGGAFANLGQTWSTPVMAKVKVNGNEKIVLIFGGGYDPQNDYVDVTTGQLGSQIYMVDAMTGDLIWWMSDNNEATLDHNDMKYSVPNKVEVLDMNNDGYVDYIYANDVAGQIFKLKVNNDNTGVTDLVSARTFAALGKTVDFDTYDDRRFYEKMTVVPVIDRDGKALYVATGTGYRARPFYKGTKDALFVLKDREIDPANFDTGKAVIEMDNLLDLTQRDDADLDIINALSDKDGYYIWFNFGLETNEDNFEGEKMIGNITATNNKLLFTTYVPNKNIFEEIVQNTSTTRNYIHNSIIKRYVDRNGSDIPGNITTSCSWKNYCTTNNEKYDNVMNGNSSVTYQMLYDFQIKEIKRDNNLKRTITREFDWHQDFIASRNAGERRACRQRGNNGRQTCYYSGHITGGENPRIYYFDQVTANTVFKDSEATHPDSNDYPALEGEIKESQVSSSTKGVALDMGSIGSSDFCEDSGLGKSRRYSINIYTAKPERLNQNEVIDESLNIMQQRYKIDTVSGFSAGTKVLYTSDGVIAITNTTVEIIDDVKGLGLYKDRWLRLLKDDESLVPPHIETLRSGE